MSGHSEVSPAFGKGGLEADLRLAASCRMGVEGAWERCRYGQADLTCNTGKLGGPHCCSSRTPLHLIQKNISM